jgi:EAL domain-containing protein (putative c-di-GMP-specific phosphodiesterase class I)
LSQADNALQQAIKSNSISQWFDTQQQQKYTREQWRDKLIKAITKNQFQFQWQPVIQMNSNDILQREVYCRLNIEGDSVNAGKFMPYIELLSLGSRLDRCLLETIAQDKILSMCYEPVAINLTHDSLNDSEFHQWLAKFLRQLPNVHSIHFELPESGVIANLEQCQVLCEIIRDNGAKFGIDHCGRQMGSLTYLQKLKPHYVKLDQSFAFYEKSEHNNELCRALINVLKGLDIEVIVTAIEDTEQLESFKSLRVDGYQGYISPPQEISHQEVT